MNILIIGAGFTGIQLANRLIDEGNIVKIIERNEDIVERISNRLDCQIVNADGNNLQVLEELGIGKMDAMVALTDNDEINMITCSLADAVYPDVLKIARVRNYAYYANTNMTAHQHAETFKGNHRPPYGIDYMIHPDVEAAQAIVKAVEHGAISDIVDFGENGDFEIIALEIEKGSKLDGATLKNIRTFTDKKFLIVYQETKDKNSDNMVSSLPSGETVLNAHDRIGIIIEKENIPDILDLCGIKTDTIKKIALVGIGRIGSIVADKIIEKDKASFLRKIFSGTKKMSQTFTIIDSDKTLCQEAEKKFPQAQVFNADITDNSFIEEEGIHKYNLVICATHNHELNMVVSAYLESLGVEKTIALVAQSQFGNIARKLGIDVAIPMRDTLVDSIISHLYGKSVTGIHTVSNGAFEIVECDLPSSSQFIGKQIKDVASHGEYLILLVKKAGSEKFELPQGNTTFSVGDHLVIIEKTGDKKILEKFSK
ncbi:NAD-binding protein [Treponema sp.]|uniref:NAD-binding protein n=1 Tax=Treponema sp. TaxID=166 RepID=UPI003F0F73B8